MPRKAAHEELVLARVKQTLGGMVRLSADGEHDLLVAAKDGRRRPITLRRIAAPSRFLVESTILHGLAEQALNRDDGPVVVVSVPRLIPRATERIADLAAPMASHGGDWAIISDAGGAILHLPSWGIARQDRDERKAIVRSQVSGRLEFSDATSWILKVLLLSRLPKRPEQYWWGGPQGAWSSGQDLASACKVSISMVYRVLETLRQRSWVEMDRGQGIRILRPRAILEAWLTQHRHREPASIPVRPLHGWTPGGAKAAMDWLSKQHTQTANEAGWAVCGWAACNLNGTAFVTDIDSRQVRIACLGAPDRLIDAWNLMRCDDPRDAAFGIVPVQAERSFAGSTSVAGLLPVVDVIQSALDVVSDPARGLDQAEHIMEVVTKAVEDCG